jgi:hypothetical protein
VAAVDEEEVHDVEQGESAENVEKPEEEAVSAPVEF